MTYRDQEIRLYESPSHSIISKDSEYTVFSKSKIVFNVVTSYGNVFATSPEEAIKLAKLQIDEYK